MRHKDLPLPSPAILHVARRPNTGVWSVIKTLAAHQAGEPGAAVALAVLATPEWHRRYGEELDGLREQGLRCWTVPTADLPFTVAYPLHLLRSQIMGNPVAGWVRRMAAETGTDGCAIHFHNAWLSGAYPPIRADGIRVGMVATYHGIQGAPQLRVQPVRRRIHRWLARRFVAHGGTLASVDASNVTVAQELFGIDPSLFTVIPNGVREPRRRASYAFRDNDDFVVGHVGTLNEGKGWSLTAEAVELLRNRGLGIRYVVAGTGPDEDRARAWCAERPDYSRFLGAVRDAADAVIPGLDVFCLPSAGEGMPMALLEALAASVPVVATKAGGMAEVVMDGCNGVTVERDPRAIAGAIEPLVRDEALYRRLSEGAGASFRESFHIRITAERYQKLYETALA